MEQKFGVITLIGCPNAGKSTLLNNIIGGKISIVSPKVQTTRTLIRGIYTHQNTQIVFVDTPGIFAPKKDLERKIIRSAWSGINEANLGLVIIDGIIGINEEFEALIKRLETKELDLYIAINKTDVITKEKAQRLEDNLKAMEKFKKIYRVSALNGTNVAEMIQELSNFIPEGPWHFDEDEITDAPNKFLAAEITREQIFLKLHQELPYSCGVETEQFIPQEDGSIKIHQVIYVSRASHKSMVIGAKGKMIKIIGENSRVQLAQIFEQPVHLYLFVKVKENWLNDMERSMIS